MIILTIRTDKPEAEIGLYEDNTRLSYKTWVAHRQLAETLHKTIKEILEQNKLGWSDIEGIVYFKGPGSFTGLRIGAALANALAIANTAASVSRGGENWIEVGTKDLREGQNEPALPYYGAEPHITVPKK